MTLLHIIDALCDVTTKQADLLRELVTDLEQTVELVRKSHTTAAENFPIWMKLTEK